VKAIQFINLGADNSSGLDDRWQLPMNHLWLGTYVNQHGYDVEVLDTNILSLNEIIQKIEAPIIAISFFVTSAFLLDKITSEAKQKGAFVVVGGQAATPLARQILQKNQNVDVVVCGDGEEAILAITKFIIEKRGTLEDIPNLAYRCGEAIVRNANRNMCLKSLPTPDRALPGIDIEAYIANFLTTNTDGWQEELRATNAYVKKGCPRRTANSGCSFCARIDESIRAKTALQAYQEYSYLIGQCNINYIYDDSDSWVEESWMKNLINLYQKFGDLNTKLRVYADIRDINENTVSMMKDLNIDSVLVGIESGDERILHLNGKPMKKEAILKASKLLGHADIKLCDAYVFGLIGETKSSVNATINLSQQLSNYCEKRISYWNIMMPLPGSPVWREMMKISKLNEKYGDEYCLDIEEVQKDYIQNFCYLGSDGYSYLKRTCEHLQLGQKIPLRKYIR